MDGSILEIEGGNQFWSRGNILHREDGPAIIFNDGQQSWLCRGLLHREDGPAIIYPDGRCSWYLRNVKIHSFYEFQKAMNLSDEDLVILKLKYGSDSFNKT